MTVGTMKERAMVTFAINTHFIRKRPAQTALTILGLSGVALVFLPFVDSHVPIQALLDALDELLFLALLGPFVVLPIFIFIGYLHWVLSGKLSRWESNLGYGFALMVVVLFALAVMQDWRESGLDMWPIFVFVAIGLGGGIWLVIQSLRTGSPSPCTALMAMQLAYLPFALGWLAVLPGSELIRDFDSILNLPIGPCLAFLTVLAYTVQIALSVRGQPRVALRLLPLGLAWLPWLGVLVSVWFES
jgi:hypothetical protein